MEKRESHLVPPRENQIRLSDYVPGIFLSIPSKKGMKKAIGKGLVQVDNEKSSTALFIKGGETIDLFTDATTHLEINLEIEVVYEDEHLAIINKPPGIEVSANKKWTIANALSTLLKPSSEQDNLTRPTPAHRLDYATSGLLIIGKTATALSALNLMFEKRAIKKTYHAVVAGTPSKEGSIDLEIDEKESLTNYEIIQSSPSEKHGYLNLVRLEPETGRRHQIRKHLTSIGHPILGDQEYATSEIAQTGQGLYLQASALQFQHPITQEALNIQIDLPKKFKRIF